MMMSAIHTQCRNPRRPSNLDYHVSIVVVWNAVVVVVAVVVLVLHVVVVVGFLNCDDYTVYYHQLLEATILNLLDVVRRSETSVSYAYGGALEVLVASFHLNVNQ